MKNEIFIVLQLISMRGMWQMRQWDGIALFHICVFPSHQIDFYDHSDVYGKQFMKDEAYWVRSCQGHGTEIIECLHAQGF